MRNDYRAWLTAQKYGGGTITSQLHRVGRVESHYGDLDAHVRNGSLENVIEQLKYSSEDERRKRPNPSKIPFDGNPRTNLASYRNAVETYRRFLSGAGPDEESVSEQPVNTVVATVTPLADNYDDAGQRIGLERDMQAALRLNIEQLEAGLTIIDDGVERYVDSGRIDITARDDHGRITVIELKAGQADQRAVAQILSYMGDVAIEEEGSEIRGILIASSFHRKTIAAARMAPALSLKTYAVQFRFGDPA